MNHPFTLTYPAVIRFGAGCRDELASLLPTIARGADAPRPFLVTTRRFAESAAEMERLRHACGDWVGVATGIPHDPPLVAVNRLAAQLRETNANIVVAIGGGSVIDTAKAAAGIAPTRSPVQPFFDGKRAISAPGLPLVALPTTAGSGAELTNNAVLTDPVANVKKSLRSPHLVAAAVLVDPELTYSAPAELTAWSGLDALTQAIEAFLSRKANTATRPLARGAVGKLFSALPLAVKNGQDIVAREEMAAGSLLSAMAFSQSGLGAIHGLAHPIGLALELAHGLTCAILLPHVLRLNAPSVGAELTELAGAIGLPSPSATAFVTAVEDLTARLGVPSGFAELGLRKTHFSLIVGGSRSASMLANPRELSDAELVALLEMLSG